jgi:hypothetical protein
MIRKLSVIAAVAGLALLVAAPALGKGQLVTTTDEEATALARSQALEKMEQALQSRGRELNGQSVTALDEEATALARSRALEKMEEALQSRGRELNGQPVTTTDEEATALARSRALEKMEQAFRARGRELNQQQGIGEPTGATVYPPDAIERAVTGQRPGTERAIDDHFRYDPAELVKPAPVSSPSGNEVEWPQIGVGFAVGILLILGIGLVLRYTRIRPLAH